MITGVLTELTGFIGILTQSSPGHPVLFEAKVLHCENIPHYGTLTVWRDVWVPRFNKII